VLLPSAARALLNLEDPKYSIEQIAAKVGSPCPLDQTLPDAREGEVETLRVAPGDIFSAKFIRKSLLCMISTMRFGVDTGNQKTRDSLRFLTRMVERWLSRLRATSEMAYAECRQHI
jgi:hypothetical protein